MVILWEEAKEAAEVVVDEEWEKWRTGVYLCVLMVTVVVEEMVVVLLVVVVVVKCGDVVTCVAEKMLLVCVRWVIDGWIWICQCLRGCCLRCERCWRRRCDWCCDLWCRE